MKVVLASNSPRRKELLAGLDIDFEVRVLKGIDESYPESLPTKDIAQYISQKKAQVYTIAEDELLLTADTIVVLGDEVMGKPSDEADAKRMLRALAGNTHQVITGVCMKTLDRESSFSVVTDVTFKNLTDEEIDYYVRKYQPYDKAGSYGIQEWIGYVGVTGLKGSYFNVMGLPVQRIYEEMKNFLK